MWKGAREVECFPIYYPLCLRMKKTYLQPCLGLKSWWWVPGMQSVNLSANQEFLALSVLQQANKLWRKLALSIEQILLPLDTLGGLWGRMEHGF